MVTKAMIDKLDHRQKVLFAVFCARQVFNLIKEEHKVIYLKCIEAAESFVEGKVSTLGLGLDYTYNIFDTSGNSNVNSTVNLNYASVYACYTVDYTNAAAADPGYAGFAAYYAADAASLAAYHASFDVKEEQLRYYDELLNFDRIVEGLLSL